MPEPSREVLGDGVRMVDQSTDRPKGVRRMEVAVLGVLGRPEEHRLEREREAVEPQSLLEVDVREQSGVPRGEPRKQRGRGPLRGPLSIKPANERDQFEVSRCQASELEVHHRDDPPAIDMHVGAASVAVDYVAILVVVHVGREFGHPSVSGVDESTIDKERRLQRSDQR